MDKLKKILFNQDKNDKKYKKVKNKQHTFTFTLTDEQMNTIIEYYKVGELVGDIDFKVDMYSELDEKYMSLVFSFISEVLFPTQVLTTTELQIDKMIDNY